MSRTRRERRLCLAHHFAITSELGGFEAPEEAVLEAFTAAQKEIDRLIDFQAGIVKEIGKPKAAVHLAEIDPALRAAVEAFLAPRLEEAVYQPTKQAHYAKLGELKAALHAHVAETFPDAHHKVIEELFDGAVNDIVHKNILEKEKRPDGRELDELRALGGEVALLPRTHGSALFMRGNTQALAVTTLAAPGAEQLIETMETTGKRRFMLHYNFPHFSVGETGRMGSPGRREIGHGNLARKAVEPLIPLEAEFPYTIRVVSEILSSNGSSSMATVCASIMSLMDAGVPLKKMAAGIAMGLMMSDPVKTTDAAHGTPRFKVLTDIQGPEDHHGDMDFKVAGTETGITALQMDVKVDGLTLEILEKALAQAKKARLEILGVMQQVIKEPRTALSPHAPAVIPVKIDPEKIGLVIGPGGKTINGMIKKFELATIDVEEDGRVFVAGPDRTQAEAAATEIRALTREIKVGEIVEGNVIKILDFGAIVDLGGGKDGMIHVSELKNGFVKNVTDVLKMGDFVRAKVIRTEDDRIGLSLKQLQD